MNTKVIDPALVISLRRSNNQLPSQCLLSAIVHAGVATFGKNRLAQPSGVFTDSAYESELLTLTGATSTSWPQLIAQLHFDKLGLTPSLLQITRDYQLTLPDLFLLALCGEIENSYWLNLALAELQAPDEYPRPRLHLICHLLESLFNVNITPIELANHPLVTAGIIDVIGDDPWPLRHMQCDTRLWLLFNHKNIPWPEVRYLSASNDALIPEPVTKNLPAIAQQIRMGNIQSVVLRGNKDTAVHTAGEIAKYLDLIPVTIAAKSWQQERKLAIAARYGRWLPIIDVELGPADVFELPPTPHQLPHVIVCGREGIIKGEGIIELDIPVLNQAERFQLWSSQLSSEPLAKTLSESAVIDGSSILRLSAAAQSDASRSKTPVREQHFLHARIQICGNRLRQLAQPVHRHVTKESLVLPAHVEQQIQQIIQRCCKRESLWNGLGCTAQSSINLGVRILFSGESGTGKTLAASYVATHLGAPLYRLDLASVMNKYIGETEKNLGLLLDEAAATDTILLMDEADALFGKRTEASGAGDRFANMLTNYLLSRIETHPGIVILTSNGRSRIDSAFTRRLDAIIEFSPPGAQERFLIWQRHLGERSPGEKFCQMLASYSELPGGFIRNAVLTAAMQIDQQQVQEISSIILLRALMDEYRKLGRAIPAKLDQLAESLIQ